MAELILEWWERATVLMWLLGIYSVAATGAWITFLILWLRERKH